LIEDGSQMRGHGEIAGTLTREAVRKSNKMRSVLTNKTEGREGGRDCEQETSAGTVLNCRSRKGVELRSSRGG